MGLVGKLARRDLLRHGWRSVLSILAIAAAVAVVVWTQGAYFTKVAQNDFLAARMLGAYALRVAPAAGGAFMPKRTVVLREQQQPQQPSQQRPVRPPVLAQTALESLRSDPAVAEVLPMRTSMVSMRRADEMLLRKPSGIMAAVAWQRQPELGGSFDGRWLTPGSDAPEVVVTRQSVERLRLNIGDDLMVVTANTEVPLKIGGMIDQPGGGGGMPGGGGGLPALYVTLPVADRIAGLTSVDAADAIAFNQIPNSAFLKLKPGSDAEAVRARLVAEVFPESSRMAVSGAKEMAAQISAGSGRGGMMDMSGYYLVGVTLLASIFIIFTTLNMGICERVRQIAMLRAVGMSRRQAAWNVLLNGLGLGAGGLLVGLAAGWAALKIMTLSNPQMYPGGVSLGWSCVAVAVLCTMGGAVAGSIFPIWTVVRLQPLQTLSPVQQLHRRGFPRKTCILGLLLMLPSYLICYVLDLPAQNPDSFLLARNPLFLALGLPTLGVGSILLMPAIVWLVERALSRPVARLFGLEPKLLSLQLTGKLWQTAGVAICLAIGLGLFISIQTWGYSMLKPFQPTADLADAVFSFKPTGVPPELLKEVYQTPGIDGERCLPVQYRQLQVGPKTYEALKANDKVMLTQDNVLVAGIDPDKAFVGDNPVFRVTFLQGEKDDAIAKLRKGGYCLIPQSFYNHSRLGVGDKVSVILPAARGMRGAGMGGRGRPDGARAEGAKPGANAGEPGGRRGGGAAGAMGAAGELPPGATLKEYEIAGVVDMPWILFTGWTSIRGQDGMPFGTMALVLTNYADGRALTASDNVTFFWSNLTPELKKLPAKQKMAALDEALSKVVDKIPETNRFDTASMQMVSVPRQALFIELEDNLISLASSHAADILWKMCHLPGWALVITLLAVVNMTMSAIRTRAWEFGVLRAAGLTGGELMRLLLAEAALVGLIAVALSLLYGIYAAACFAELAKYYYMFGGLPIELVIPWGHIVPGIALAVVLTLLAALLPGALLARKRPGVLLQQGKQTM